MTTATCSRRRLSCRSNHWRVACFLHKHRRKSSPHLLPIIEPDQCRRAKRLQRAGQRAARCTRRDDVDLLQPRVIRQQGRGADADRCPDQFDLPHVSHHARSSQPHDHRASHQVPSQGQIRRTSQRRTSQSRPLRIASAHGYRLGWRDQGQARSQRAEIAIFRKAAIDTGTVARGEQDGLGASVRIPRNVSVTPVVRIHRVQQPRQLMKVSLVHGAQLKLSQASREQVLAGESRDCVLNRNDITGSLKSRGARRTAKSTPRPSHGFPYT